MSVSVTMDLSGFQAWARRAVNGIASTDFRKDLKACAIVLKNTMREDMQAGRSPDGTPYRPLKFARPNGKSHPLWDTGALVRSVSAGARHVEKIDRTSMEIGTNMEYANLQQEGGVVRPKMAKFLCIPLTMAAKRAGSPRNFPGQLEPRISRDKQRGVLIGAKRGVVQRGKRKGQPTTGKVEAQYAMVKKVTIPPRPFIGMAVRARTQVERILLDGLAARIP